MDECLPELKTDPPSVEDGDLVDWDDRDAANPQNWSTARKWANTVIVSVFPFTASLSSSMVAPCLPTITADLEIQNAFISQMVVTAYVLSWGVGPLAIGPLSEVYGRFRVLQVGNFIYLIFNLACAFVQHADEMIVLRVLAGLGSSAPLAVVDGILGDMWPHERLGRAAALETSLILLGPAVGPIIGGVIDTYTTWRWTFRVTSIATSVVALGGAMTLRESYAPYLLRRKAKQLREKTNNPRLHCAHELEPGGLLRMLALNLIRPARLLTTQVIVQCVALYGALIYGLLYIIIASYASIMIEVYHENSAISSLHYIALGVGFSLGAHIGARLNDMIYKSMKDSNGGIGAPEYHLPLMIPGCVLLVVGFIWFGWSIQFELPWIMPDIGIALTSAGFIVPNICIQTYTIEAYPRYAASTMSVYVFTRCLAGFVFPLFSPYLFAALGYGWGATLLALITLLVGLPMSIILWRYGRALRARSPFAQG